MKNLLKNPGALGATLALLALTLLLAWQNALAIENASNLSRVIKERTQPAAQARQVQASIRKLLNDVLVLSAKNSNARAVVQKYNIQRGGNTPAAPAEEK